MPSEIECEATEIQIDQPEGFTVRDAASAAWVVRKITEARRYAERVRAWAAAELRRAEREERFFMDRFGRPLEGWCRQQIESEGGRRNSISLPSGIVGFRRASPVLRVVDDKAVLNWCRKNLPSAVFAVEHYGKQVINEHVAETGELPDGAIVDPGGPKFYIR